MIEAVIWALALIYLVERIRPLGDRTIRLYESKLLPPSPKIDLPLDLQRHVATQSEDWAREQVEKFIREQYDEHHDWDLVREKAGLKAAHDSASPI